MVEFVSGKYGGNCHDAKTQQKVISAAIDFLMTRSLQLKLNLEGKGLEGKHGVKTEYPRVYLLLQNVATSKYGNLPVSEINFHLSNKLRNAKNRAVKKVSRLDDTEYGELNTSQVTHNDTEAQRAKKGDDSTGARTKESEPYREE